MPTDNNSKETTPAVLQPEPIAPALRRRLQQCFEHASKLMAMEKYDFDYAHTLLVECVTHDPGNLVYVETFLQNLQRKYGNNKKGAAFTGFGGKGALKKIVAAKNWPEMLKAGPGLLKTNPWDIALLRAMADACAAFDFREVELRYLKNALDASPADPEVNRHCAKSLQRMGQFDQAIVCWHRVETALRDDEEAPRMIGQLQIEKTRASAGFGEPIAPGGKPAAGSAPTGKMTPTANATTTTATPTTPAEPAKKREIQLSPRQQLERALKENPEDVGLLLQLADLHLQEERVADGEKILQKALSISGNDLRVRERLEDASVLRLKQKVQVAERMAASEKTQASQDLVGQLRMDLNRQELEIFNSRSERYPDDLNWKFQLAVRLKRAGNFAEAIKNFQSVAQDEKRRPAVLLEIGECQQMLRQYKLAIESYKTAISLTKSGSDSELRKVALYRGAALATGLKDVQSAEQWLTELLEIAPKYKDARDRLDKIRQIRDK